MDAREGHGTGPGPRKVQGELVADRIVMVTAYDATFAALADEAGVDVVLVGTSLGMVVQGVANTLPVALDEAVYHTRLAARGATRARRRHLFGSYQVSPQQGVESSIRLIKEGERSAAEVEGGVPMADTIEAITAADIPVMAHIGLTPQSFHRMGGHRGAVTSGSHAGGRDACGRRQGRRGGRCLQRGAGGDAAVAAPRSPPTSRSRQSASAPARSATARCSCCTTSWA